MIWHSLFYVVTQKTPTIAFNKWLDNRRKVNNYENAAVNCIAL